MNEPLYVGTVKPPGDMMEAARLSLSPIGFDNLMLRTCGRAPTPAELCEFADNERAAQEVAQDRSLGAIHDTLEGAAAAFVA